MSQDHAAELARLHRKAARHSWLALLCVLLIASGVVPLFLPGFDRMLDASRRADAPDMLAILIGWLLLYIWLLAWNISGAVRASRETERLRAPSDEAAGGIDTD